MSRIDQALQRANLDRLKQGGPENEQAFVSPWAPTDAEASPPAAPEPGDSAVAAPDGGETTAQPLLVSERVPSISLGSSWRERRAVSPEADPVLVEQYRRLAAVLQHAQTSAGIKVLMITSAAPEDGKTLTALNLAMVLSESYQRRVLLIDADLRRPSLGSMLELADVPGLGEALRAPTNEQLAVIQLGPNFMLLPGGQPDPDPMSRLTSGRMRAILDSAADRFDWVILDAPPMGPMADAQFLAGMVDTVAFVIRAGHSPHAQVEKAIQTLGRDRIIGVILNGVEDMPTTAYKYATGNRAAGGE